MNEDQEDPTSHYTINMQTHYTVQYKDKHCTWVGDVGKIKYYNSIAEAEAAIQFMFNQKENLYHVEEATIFEWKKTPVFTTKNNKPFTETKTWYDVEVYHTAQDGAKPHWHVRGANFETLTEAKQYFEENTKLYLFKGNFRIVKREAISKTTIIQ